MKKTFYQLFFAGLFLMFGNIAVAQEEEGGVSFFGENGELATNIPTSVSLEERKPIEYNNPRADDIIWQKVVYRIVDLREKMNFPLYFPEETSDNRQSLFTTIFRLFERDQIKCYSYKDNVEFFTENELVKFDDIFPKYGMVRPVKRDSVSGDTTIVEFDESDIPNREVLKYYVKEVWYFDKHNSHFNVRIMAICPIWYRQDYDLGLQKTPLFWVPFDLLRPYLAQNEILVSDRNNGARETMDDLFIKRRFGSYIYKESSTRNRNLLQYNSTAEQMNREQERIKNEIFNFEQDLWEY